MRLLTDADLLPEGFVASQLLAHTLPVYYVTSLRLARTSAAETAVAERVPAHDDATKNSNAATDTAASAAEMPETIGTVVEETELLLDLTLIYSEVSIAALVRACELTLIPPLLSPFMPLI